MIIFLFLTKFSDLLYSVLRIRLLGSGREKKKQRIT